MFLEAVMVRGVAGSDGSARTVSPRANGELLSSGRTQIPGTPVVVVQALAGHCLVKPYVS